MEEQGSFNGEPYNQKQVNIEWDHIAVVSQGRCSSLQGCGLYMETFDSVVNDSEKLEHCIEQVKAKGHSEESAWAICRASLNESNTVQDMDWGSDLYLSSNNGSYTFQIREDNMSDDNEKEITELKAQNEAKDKIIEQLQAKEREQLLDAVVEKTKIPKEKLTCKTNDVLEALMELMPQPPSIPGQDAAGQTAGAPPPVEEEDVQEDPELIPGYRVTIGVKDGLLNPKKKKRRSWVLLEQYGMLPNFLKMKQH